MKFCEMVTDISTHGGEWPYYDKQFRYIPAHSREYPWDIVHWELPHRAVTFLLQTLSIRQAQPQIQGKTEHG